jgi:hypothetical protein
MRHTPSPMIVCFNPNARQLIRFQKPSLVLTVQKVSCEINAKVAIPRASALFLNHSGNVLCLQFFEPLQDAILASEADYNLRYSKQK